MGYIKKGYENEYYITTCEDCTKFHKMEDGKGYCAWDDTLKNGKDNKCRQFIYDGGDKEQQLEQGIKALTDKIRRLDSDNILVIEKVCKLLGEYAEHNLYFDYKYHIIHYTDFGGIWVLYYDEREIMEESHEFLNSVAEMLDDSVLTWDNLAIEEEHLADIYEIWYDEIERLENI